MEPRSGLKALKNKIVLLFSSNRATIFHTCKSLAHSLITTPATLSRDLVFIRVSP
jgi:hypothetical protein